MLYYTKPYYQKGSEDEKNSDVFDVGVDVCYGST